MYNPPPSKMRYIAALAALLNVSILLIVANGSIPKVTNGIKVALQWAHTSYGATTKKLPTVVYVDVIKKP